MTLRELDYEEIGIRIQQLRQERGYGLNKFARAIDSTVERVEQIEKGRDKPTLDELSVMCDELKVMPEKMLYGQEDMSRRVLTYLITNYLSGLDDTTRDIIYDACLQINQDHKAG